MEEKKMKKYENLEQLTKENFIARPFKRLAYFLRPEKIILDKEQYCYVINKKSGEIPTQEGPCRRVLAYDEQLLGSIEDKIIVPEHSFCVIKNPIDEGTQEIQHGKREIRVGPKLFPLYPGEELEQIRSEYVLTKYDGLLIKTLTSFDGHNAGDEFLVIGPKTYIPTKNEKIVKEVRGTPLSDTDGIYVQNKDTGDARLVKGTEEETIYFLQPNEQLFQKDLTKDELAGLGLIEQGSSYGVRVLTRQAANDSYLRDNSIALVLELEDNEVIYIFDGSDTRIEKGPKTTFLEPYERPKVLNLSGGKPIEQNALKVALLKLGPDFIYDQITVRTRDNAQLRVDVTYKWRFDLTDDNLKKAFNIEDFVGYAAETLSSEIRSVAAQYDFEEFHAKSIEYIKTAVFGEGDSSRIFEENGLKIFGIDITSIAPEDPNIAEKLHQAIKQNMDIYCNKLVLKATLEAERQEVEGQMKIEKERKKLIQSQNVSKRLEATEEARIDAESRKIAAESEAEAIKIKADAEIEAEKRKLNTIINELNQEGARNYLDLQRAEVFSNAEKLVIVPTDSKIVLPYVKDPFEEE